MVSDGCYLSCVFWPFFVTLGLGRVPAIVGENDFEGRNEIAAGFQFRSSSYCVRIGFRISISNLMDFFAVVEALRQKVAYRVASGSQK